MTRLNESAWDSPDSFVQFFETGWSLPKPGAFTDFFVPHLHDDFVSTQPIFPEARGRDGFVALFGQVFDLIEDFVIAVDSWAANGDSIFIKASCTGRLGGTFAEFEVCDRFGLRNELILRRESYFDPIPLIAVVT
jgi:limonene-1,2-epoxide hydrolase